MAFEKDNQLQEKENNIRNVIKNREYLQQKLI